MPMQKPTARLSDDGTCDTVIVVKDREYRFNYDPESWIDDYEYMDDEPTDEQNEAGYDKFLDWAMEESVDDYLTEVSEGDTRDDDDDNLAVQLAFESLFSGENHREIFVSEFEAALKVMIKKNYGESDIVAILLDAIRQFEDDDDFEDEDDVEGGW